MTERAFLIWGAAACALLGGCAAEVVDGPQADDEDVALTAEALGNTVTVASGLGPVLVSWNGSRALFRTGFFIGDENCTTGTQWLKRVDLGTGAVTTFDASCINFEYRAALDNSGSMFVGDVSNNDILQVAQSITKRADTTGALPPSNSIFANANHVFWVDNGGLKRMPVGGGPVQTLLTSAIRVMGVDATRVYALRLQGGALKIAQLAVDGSSLSTVPLPSLPMTGFAVDSLAYYITSFDGSTLVGKLTKVPKSGGATSELASAPGTVMFLPVAHNVLGSQYWVRQNTVTGVFDIMRRTSNGFVTVQKSNTGNITGMHIRSGAELFWSTETGAVKKASLP